MPHLGFQGSLLSPLFQVSKFSMYINSLALNTKGSLLFTCSSTRPFRWDTSWPGWLKWWPLGFSNRYFEHTAYARPAVLENFWNLAQHIRILEIPYSYFSHTSSSIHSFWFHSSLHLLFGGCIQCSFLLPWLWGAGCMGSRL